MRRAFTLIEMLVVIVIMAILLSIAFKLGAIADGADARVRTVARLQKLENCLGGYYSAFGSYPPVKLYESRDPFVTVYHNVQTKNHTSSLVWENVKHACQAQPVACRMPFREGMRETVEAYSDQIKRAVLEHDAYAGNPMQFALRQGFTIGIVSTFNSVWNLTDWSDVQLYKFGLMSFLLPRYLVMTQSNKAYWCSNSGCAQWTDNNDTLNNAMTGKTMTWQQVADCLPPDDNTDASAADFAKVANMPTQAVTARWLANLAIDNGDSAENAFMIGSLAKPGTLFGVEIFNRASFSFPLGAEGGGGQNDYPPCPELFSVDGKSNFYILDQITARDGWNQDFYYYSPAGFQSYALWSGGANMYTFPPWLARDKLTASQRETVASWTQDDIIRMNQGR